MIRYILLTVIGLTPGGSSKGKAVSFTGLDRPRGLQEVKAPKFRDSGTGWW